MSTNTQYSREWWKERLHLIQAFAEGKCVENVSINGKKWIAMTMLQFESAVENYRIAQETKLRPWSQNDAPLGAWIRWKGDGRNSMGYAVIVYVDDRGVPVPCEKQNRWLDFVMLMEDYEHSTDNGKTWHPCGVLESQV